MRGNMPVTVQEVAEQIAASLRGEDRERGLAEARRLAFSFVEVFGHLSAAANVRLD
jgi:DNA-directed RNA polymerase subunit F